MKEINLTTWERTRLTQLITEVNTTRAQACNLVLLRKFLRLLDVLNLTEKEKVTVGWADLEVGSTWIETAHEFALSFEDADYLLLYETIRDYTGWSPAEGHLADILGKKFEL